MFLPLLIVLIVATLFVGVLGYLETNKEMIRWTRWLFLATCLTALLHGVFG